jgi:hypothetical protein
MNDTPWFVRGLACASASSPETIPIASIPCSITHCRNHTDLCDAGFSKWAQITDEAKDEMQKEFGLVPAVPMKHYSRCGAHEALFKVRCP